MEYQHFLDTVPLNWISQGRPIALTDRVNFPAFDADLGAPWFVMDTFAPEQEAAVSIGL